MGKSDRKNADFENLLAENQKLRYNFRDVSADLEHAIEELKTYRSNWLKIFKGAKLRMRIQRADASSKPS